MPDNREIRVALVGCGNIGVKGHIPAYAELPGARIATVCDTDKKLAKEAGALTGASVHTDFGELLASENIDAVDICPPPWTHAELAIKAAEAGKHILCEKPIAPSLDDADAMIAAAAANGVRLMVGQTRRFDHRYRAIKGDVADGQRGAGSDNPQNIHVVFLTR